MAIYTITSTDEQESALALVASQQKTTNQQVLMGLVNDTLVDLVNTQKQTLLASIGQDGLETLEQLAAQPTNPANTPV